MALYVLAGLLITSVVMWTTSTLFYYKICMTASRSLHNRMFSSLIKAPMRFYEINPSGELYSLYNGKVHTFQNVAVKIKF